MVKKHYIKAWIKPRELKLADELCLKKGYKRSTLIREIIMFCIFHNLSPDEIRDVMKDYNNLREQVKNKTAPIKSAIEWWK